MSTITVTWTCNACAGAPEFNQADFLKHLQEAHNIAPKTPGTREGVMFADGKGYSNNVFKWTIAGLEFTQSVRSERSKA